MHSCVVSRNMAAKEVIPAAANERVNLYREYGGALSNNIDVKAASKDETGSVFTFAQSKGSSVGVVKLWEPMSPLLNYFEIEILDKGMRTALGLGVGNSGYSMSAMPGWNSYGIGYHADDGHLFHQSGSGRAFGPTCTKGDIMGCGIDFSTDCGTGYAKVWFTKNGKKVGEPEKMKRPLQGFCPLIGMHSKGESVRYLGHSYRDPESLELGVMESIVSPHSIWMRCNGVRFRSGETLYYDGTSNAKRDVGVAIANFFLTPINHYFELTIVEGGECCEVGIGLAKRDYSLVKFPGWNEGSVGYHSDNGHLYKERGSGTKFGPKCVKGDVMGCGIKFLDPYYGDDVKIADDDLGELEEVTEECEVDSDESYYDSDYDDYPQVVKYKTAKQRIYDTPAEKKIGRPHCIVYFTKNGTHIGETEIAIPIGGFYPIVGVLSSGENISVNLHPLTG